MDLFDNVYDEPDDKLSINQSYADRYHHNKQRVHLEQLQQKYGDDPDAAADSTDSEEDEEEDEEGEQLTPQVDAAILRTLQRIRSKDPELYKPGTNIFNRERDAVAQLSFPEAKKQASAKRMTLQDYQRQRMQEIMQKEKDPALAYAEATVKDKRVQPEDDSRPPTHDEEQEALRAELAGAFKPDDTEGELFQVRKEGDDTSGSTYREALLRALEQGQAEGASEEQLRRLLQDNSERPPAAGDAPALSKDNEDFLMDYILNRGWAENEDPRVAAARKEMKKGADTGGEEERDWDAEAAELESDGSFDSAADAFEQAYNFRFEDPSLAQQSFAIPSFPRRVEGSMRRTDDRRKRARQERSVRKEEEKQAKMRELDQLKSLKRQAIAEKLRQLREASGSDNRIDGDAFDDLDLNEDFDPAKHDEMMRRQFDEEYYEQPGDEVKPEWDDEIDDILKETEPEESSRKKSKKNKKKKRSDDDHIDMDADFEGEQEERKLSKKERKQLKKQEKKKKKRESEKRQTTDGAVSADEMDADAEPAAPVSEPDRKKRAKELMDEYYNLGYEDMIGDQPTRFKYTSVPKSDYGMSATEILLADDADLNKVVGLKRLQPYNQRSKPGNLGNRLKRFREDLAERYGGEDDPSKRPKKQRLGKKERQKLRAQRMQDGEGVESK